MDYPGKVITKTQVTPTQTSASGNWTLDDQAAAIKNNNWPVALVPNPISKSLRFNSADSAYLNRTVAAAATSNTLTTLSFWFKRAKLGTSQQLFASATSAPNVACYIELTTSDTLKIYLDMTAGGSDETTWTTSAVFRDVSAWYGATIKVDTSQASNANKVLLYINGVSQTLTASQTGTAVSTQRILENGISLTIGKYFNSSGYGDFYLTEFNCIDGQALTPSSFGMTNPQTGQWIPLKYSGTYGTNGFYLNFKDATSTTTLGYDYSGNANNWTTNNFSVTAGVNNDSFTDVPTPWVAYNTVDSGGVVRGNYCTLNPLVTRGASTTFSNGNLTYTNTSGSSDQYVFEGWSTITSQYYECTATTVAASSQYIYAGDNAGYYCSNGQIYINGSLATTVATYTSGDVLGFAITVGGIIRFYKNGTLVYTSSGVAAGSPLCNGFSSTVWNFNFGQRAFNSTPPAGYKSLCTTNLPATAIGFGLTNQGDDYFNAVLYSGNGTSQTIDTGLQPDFIWIKRRNGAAAHTLTDSVRGISKQLFSNLTDAEQTDADSGVTAISSSSITLGDNNLAVGSVNGSGSTYVAWNWKASGSTVSNTSGTITSTVSANTTAGFSIVTYTGTAANATVGHGLGVAPKMIITKRRTTFTSSWGVWHISIAATEYLLLNSTAAKATATTAWNSTAPSSTVVSLGDASFCNGSVDGYVMYCFAAVPGYSSFGSYTGNGSTDGPFVYLGFRPRFLLLKISSTTGDWAIYDTSRNTYNVMDLYLYPNSSAAEAGSGTPRVDALSNGFKLRQSGQDNTSSATYIYAAFAEAPFQFANAR